MCPGKREDYLNSIGMITFVLSHISSRFVFLMPSIALILSFTSMGSDSATGQLGDVNVITISAENAYYRGELTNFLDTLIVANVSTEIDESEACESFRTQVQFKI